MEWHKAQYSCWSSISYTNLTSCQHIDPNLCLQRSALANLAATSRDLLWKKAQVTHICICKGSPKPPWQCSTKHLLWKKAHRWGQEILPQNPHNFKFLTQRNTTAFYREVKNVINTRHPANVHKLYCTAFTATFAGGGENNSLNQK